MSNQKTLSVLPIGIVGPNTGKTCYDWNLYSEFQKGSTVYLMQGGFLILAGGGGLEVDQEVILRNNDSNRKLQESKVIAKTNCNRDDVLKMLLDHEYDYYTRRAFKKKRFDSKLRTSYSLKGVE